MFNSTELCYVGRACPWCGKYQKVLVCEADYDAWMNDNLLAQEAFPYLTVSEREILISGICPTCWDKMFSEEEEA